MFGRRTKKRERERIKEEIWEQARLEKIREERARQREHDRLDPLYYFTLNWGAIKEVSDIGKVLQMSPTYQNKAGYLVVDYPAQGNEYSYRESYLPDVVKELWKKGILVEVIKEKDY